MVICSEATAHWSSLCLIQGRYYTERRMGIWCNTGCEQKKKKEGAMSDSTSGPVNKIFPG